MTTALQSFPRAAESYDRHAQVQRALATWLSEWLPVVRRGRALEIGAGTGIFTRLVGEWPEGWIATDIAPEMCRVGKRSSPAIEWHPMAAENPLRGPWAWMFSSAMLQWVERPEAVFKTWHERLASGGRVLGALFAAGSLAEWRTLAGSVDPVEWRTPAEWRTCLERGGLRILREETQARVFRYASAREFLRSLHGVGAAPERRLSPVELRRLLDKMEQRFGGPNGVPATWVFYRFEAERSDI
jgi:malonyl-CoA O-methyltransferase